MNVTTTSPQTNHTQSVPGRPAEFRYLEQLISFRIHQYFGTESGEKQLPPLPDFKKWSLCLPNRIAKELSQQEAGLLLLALAPHVQPELLDQVIESQLPRPGDFREIGGVRGKNFRGLLPTGETALFLLAGNHFQHRREIQKLFEPDRFLAKQQILWLEELPPGEPTLSGKMIMSPEYVELFSTGRVSKPRFGINFPAQQLETRLEWDDLVLSEDTMKQVEELKIWVQHHSTLLQQWGMGKKLGPGYKVLFHGPPGTGKTLTASLLGKYTGRDVFKIDLSMVISKFIGETEKNLANLFDRAENKDWILFFDEADALFGKRTSVRDAHDKYANQEVSFLLQRIEYHHGLVILATNFKSNIDDAFARRFQAHVYFPPPKYNERLLLWKKAFPEIITLDKDAELPVLARQYELTGAQILNVVQYACLRALAKDETVIRGRDLLQGIQNEYGKEGKILS